MKTDSKVAVVASIIANVAIAITKIAVALATSSTAMLAEGVHSIINCFDGTLLLIGDSRAKQPPDASHPFGYGREVFFWSLIVAVLFFALGGGFSIYEGIRRTVAPRPLGDPKWSYIVLGIAALFDGTSFVIGLRTFRAHAGGRAIWRAVRESKNPALFSVVLEDIADLSGLALAFLGVLLSHAFDQPRLDGVAAVLIGLVLTSVATLLLIETHSLLIGESASPALVRAIRNVLREQQGLSDRGDPATVHLGPDAVLVALRLGFAPGLSAEGAVASIDDVTRRIRMEHPEVRRVLVELLPPNAPDE